MTLKRKNYILSAVFLGLFLIFVLFVIFPLLNSIKNNAAEIKAEKGDLALSETKAQNLRYFKDKYQNSQGVQKIKDLFVDFKTPIGFITFLEKTAQKEGITPDISLLPSLKKGGAKPFPALGFLIKGRTSFLNLYNFLYSLEKAPYLIEIENLTLQKERKQGQKETLDNILDFSLSLRVYAKDNSKIKD